MSVDVPLDNIRIKEIDTITLGGGVNFGIPPLSIAITNLPAISVGVTELPDLNFNLSVDELPLIRLETNSAISSDSRLNTDSKVKTDNKVDLALDVRIRELPQIDLQFGFRPMRFHSDGCLSEKCLHETQLA
ncbi:hypothetical protein [Allohahella marinimesophila]|uniref:Uncharacterized protein n=1 Tax=Allohahella marinimesophila TaxID=1054972 RepID=A0ABP7NZZ4_9GAMM